MTALYWLLSLFVLLGCVFALFACVLLGMIAKRLNFECGAEKLYEQSPEHARKS